MKRIVALVLFLAVSNAIAAEVIATGVGKTSADALTNAKTLAAGQITGSFIVGHQTTDGSAFSSRTEEFNGGLITRYEVLSTDHSEGLVRITIRAEVDPDKANTRIEQAEAEIPPRLADEFAKAAEEHEKLGRMVSTIDDRSQAFSVQVRKVDYRNSGKWTEVRVTLKIGWQPKFVDDLRVLGKAVGREIKTDNSKANFLWGIAALSALVSPTLPGTLFSLARRAELKVETSDDEMICFSPNAWTDVDSCHVIRHSLPNTTGRSAVKIVGRLVGATGSIPLDPTTVDTDVYLFRHVRSGSQLYFSRGGYRDFGNPGVIVFREGSVEYEYRFNAKTEDLQQITRIEFYAG